MQLHTAHVLKAKAAWLICSRRLAAIWLSAVLVILLPENLLCQTTAPDVEYSIKAVFLFNFAQFVKWPAQTFAASCTPITIGILGRDPFGKILDDTVSGESIEGRKLVVKRLASVAEATSCQILFVSRSEQQHETNLLAALKDAPVLTVGEMDQFCQHGGIINFFIQDNKVKFEANPEAAEAAGILINSQLLNVAKVVKTEK
jgi:hypothetical protein